MSIRCFAKLSQVVHLGVVLLALSACNPLGGSSSRSTFDDNHFPGIPNQNAANNIPVASAGTLSINEDVTGTGTLTATDESALTYSIVTNGAHGTATVTNAATGAYSYVPVANYYGSDSFTFKANDGTTDSNTATVTVTVTRLADDTLHPANDGAAAASIPFTALTTASYTSSDWTKMDFTGDLVRLSAKDQTDSSTNSFTGGSLTGVVYSTSGLSDGSSGLKLDSSGTPTNNSELDASWTPQWASLVGYWKMNNNWNDSKGSNNGTAYNGATFSTSSKLGSHAGTFDGNDDYVEVADNASLNFGTGNFTVSFWAKYPSQAGGSRNYAALVGKFDTAGTRPGFAILALDGSSTSTKLSFYISSTDQIYSNTAGLDNDTWRYCTFTRSGTTISIHINGVLDNSGTVALATVTSTFPLRFGMHETLIQEYSGKLDDIAIWSTALTASEIKTIYDRQSAKYAGTFTSRVMDAGSSSSWGSLSWVPTLPFFKELPDAACAGATCTHVNKELIADYSSLYNNSLTNNLMDGIVGLWHFNESSWADVANEVKDDSGQGNHGRGKNGATTTSNGKFSRGGFFDGTNDHVSLGAATPTTFPMGSSPRTINVWANIGSATNQTFISYGNTAANQLNLFYVNTTIRIAFIANAYDTGIAPSLNTWEQWTMTYDGGTTLKLYRNGTVAYTNTTITAPNTTTGTDNNIGYYSSGGWLLGGLLDEIAIWSRALHANEVKQLYQRGASRLKYQVRSCAASTCNETTEPWKGPDGTTGTYFSELNNNSVALDGSGDVKATLPTMTFLDFASPFFSASRQYFQYRAIFETDSATVSDGPELKSVTVGPVHYDASAPYIYNNTTIATDFFSLSSFSPTGVTCAGVAKYQLSSNNGVTWWWWDASLAAGAGAWASNGTAYASASTATEITTNISTFKTSAGTGLLQVRTFLKSDGLTPCQIDDIAIGGAK